MSTKRKIETHKDLTLRAMNENVECRNSDIELLLQVLSYKGVELSRMQKNVIRYCGVEFNTLLRARQRIQSEGNLLPTNLNVAKKRRKMQLEYTKHFSESWNSN